MKNISILLIVFMFLLQTVSSQVLLEANGKGNTYELITSILAPGYDAVEDPDSSHKEFGPHIDQIFDHDLNAFVFRFHIHKTPDNDRGRKFDRQRNEIKAYSKSPKVLLGKEGDSVEFKWKFKLDEKFQPSKSFTHLHQLKAVGGKDEGMPLLTLTARKGNPDKLELRYARESKQITLYSIDLSPLKGKWVEVTEVVTYAESGSYSITIKEVGDGSTLFEYSNDSIDTWKTAADFVRPKWGIYRSLKDSDRLRDEIVLFANFSINKLPSSSKPSK